LIIIKYVANTLLLNAIKNKRSIGYIESLLTSGASPNTFSKSKTTPLLYAIIQNNIPLAMLLLENGADPNFTVDGELLPPPLIMSAIHECTEITKLLIEYDANIDICDKFGRTALIYAAKNNNIEMTKLLFENGVNAHISDNNGQTALMHARLVVEDDRYINIFQSAINIHYRRENLTYMAASNHKTVMNTIGKFVKISNGSRQDWKRHILSFSSLDIKECA
jgi:ankyrin repeat protein